VYTDHSKCTKGIATLQGTCAKKGAMSCLTFQTEKSLLQVKMILHFE